MNTKEIANKLLRQSVYSDGQVYAARYKTQLRDSCGEIWQLIDCDGNSRLVSRDEWGGKVTGWHTLCGIEDGYEEQCDTLHCHIILCNQKWEPITTIQTDNDTYTLYGNEVLKMKDVLAQEGVITGNELVDERAFLAPLWKANPHGDVYIENCAWNRWHDVGKPKVLKKFNYAGMKCYILQQQSIHHYLKVRRTEIWAACAEMYWDFPHPIIGRTFDIDESIPVFPGYPIRETTEDSLVVCDKDKYKCRVALRDCCYTRLTAPNMKVYRSFCKENGLRPVIPHCDGDRKNLRAGFRVVDAPYGMDKSDFTPYPVMSNGEMRMGGFKVLYNDYYGDVLVINRVNPNIEKPIMTWQEAQEWEREHVAL